jgi:hypothetical protein
MIKSMLLQQRFSKKQERQAAFEEEVQKLFTEEELAERRVSKYLRKQTKKQFVT